MENIYFDNAATTKVRKEVSQKVVEMMEENYGNPSSSHNLGVSAEKEIIKASKIIANIIGASQEHIYFTSGGTESNNLAILGVANAYKKRGNHIIVSSIEHPSVLFAIKQLQQHFKITSLKVDQHGQIDEEELKSAITEKTILVSIMHVNNEFGSIQNIERLGNFIKKQNSQTVFHVDAVQSFCKLEINVVKSKIDLLSGSGHKIHAPKGIGFLYVNKAIKINPLLFGGGQQKDIRPGTENTPFIAGLGTASEIAFNTMKKNSEQISLIKNKLWREMESTIEDVFINGGDISSPYILNVSFANVKSEVLLHALEMEKIYVSAGSACSSKNAKKSTALSALGVSDELADGSIRFSFSKWNTPEEVDYCILKLREIIQKLRKYSRR